MRRKTVSNMRAHQQRQSAALEFVVDEKFDLASLLAGGVKGPAVLHAAKGPVEIFDQDLEVGPIERGAAGEGLADHLVGNRHGGDHDGDALAFLGAAAHAHAVAQRHEFGIFLDVRHQIEHVGSGVGNAARGGELRHEPFPVRGASRRAPPSGARSPRRRDARSASAARPTPSGSPCYRRSSPAP